jgi:hypothetical protein
VLLKPPCDFAPQPLAARFKVRLEALELALVDSLDTDVSFLIEALAPADPLENKDVDEEAIFFVNIASS